MLTKQQIVSIIDATPLCIDGTRNVVEIVKRAIAAIAAPAEGREARLSNFQISKEWLEQKLAGGDEPGCVMAVQPTPSPSCLCCGHVGERAAWHISHPSIYVCKTCKDLATAPTMSEADAKDAARYRWLCDGNGYFLEEQTLCGHWNEKARADAAIDAEIDRAAAKGESDE